MRSPVGIESFEVLHRIERDKPALVDKRDVVAEFFCFVHVMRSQDDRRVLCVEPC